MNNKILVLIIVTAWVSSCTIYKEYPVDIYKPGETTLPSNALNIAIVSRNFKYNIDTLQHYYKTELKLVKDKKNQHINIDSLAVSRTLKGIATELQNSEKFAEIELWPYNIIKQHKGEKLSPFKWEIVNNLTNPVNADLLISLESLSYFFSSLKSNDNYPPFNQVITASVWGIYDPSSEKIIEQKQLIDTIYWDGYDNDGGKNYNVPNRLDAIELACEIAGKNYAKRLSPSWLEVNRMYIIPPVEDFRLAAGYFENGKWNDAI
ncbi:MAG: hypothetical protein HQ541_10030, partial [Mariniphaga sp.]|nr:hypothetical protein [Mariniphaga sp.]